MSKARIFRQILERAKPPESEFDLWLEPARDKFWLLVYKRETQEWISLGTKTAWGDVLDKPSIFQSEENFNEYVNNLIEGAGIADSVAFDYNDGTVSQIENLPKVLKRTVDGEEKTLVSVDAVLEAIIAKLWFQSLGLTLAANGWNGKSVYVGDEVPAVPISYSAANYVDNEYSKITVKPNGVTVNWDEEDGSRENSGTIAKFTAVARRTYSVKVDVACDDADGNHEGQKKSATVALNAYYPIWVWSSATETTTPPTDSKKMLTSLTSASFKFKPGNYYYYMLLPDVISIKEATQGLKGDWEQKISLIERKPEYLSGTGYNYNYNLWGTTAVQTNGESTDKDVTITLDKIG